MEERPGRVCWVCGRELDEGDVCPDCARKREKDLDKLLEPILREKRRHRRYLVALPMAYQRPREAKARRAEVMDISQGGLRFTSSEELDSNEVINVLVRASDGSVDVRAVVRVLRSTPSQSGWEVATEFVARGTTLSMRDRRGAARMETDLPLSYTRRGEAEPRKGLLRDVSQGGMRFVAREKLTVGEKITVSLGEGEGAGATVERVRKAAEGYEVRVSFSSGREEGSQWKGV